MTKKPGRVICTRVRQGNADALCSEGVEANRINAAR